MIIFHILAVLVHLIASPFNPAPKLVTTPLPVVIQRVSPTPSASPTLSPRPTPTHSLKPTFIFTPAPTYKPTPAPTSAPVSQGLSNDNTYVNSAGNTVHSPAYSNTVPAGATAVCGDGTYSFSQSRSGTCSHHGGVSEWL